MGNNPPQMTEHRGWEPSADYHEHWMDDPDWDVAEDQSESGSSAIFVLGTILLFGAGLWWLAGEKITHIVRGWFGDEPKPSNNVLFYDVPNGQCLKIDKDGNIIGASTNCTIDPKSQSTESPKRHGK